MSTAPNTSQTYVVQSYKRQLTERFRKAGIVAAQEEALDLLMAVTGFSLTDIALRGKDELSEVAMMSLSRLAARRLGGEPLDMILGWREFYGRKFKVTKDVLSPRGDSETLILSCLSALEGKTSPSILDLGTGSGALALTLLAERPDAQALAVDLSDAALSVAKENAKALKVVDRCELIQSDWFENVTGQFDLIVSNPPYITNAAMEALETEVLNYDPDLALRGGEDGLEAYRKILSDYRPFLKIGGALWVEIGYDQGASISELFKQNGVVAPRVVKDLAGHDRCVGGEYQI
ncbi:[protein release factor]-glutamine N5-methyltransferase [Litorimonas taeanensis]|uniref:Release factor glutamine methyltransferase n=1 Tax=Litorimonas taeanensis TaxID=568099 RepID=A0A420WLB9_9PROT|nr:peptide chain release factor N(5)-glutamine methyltransferase [Litorimonas taeanensis]RKQ71817.1 [protein release factor]-glutamine N5-methyltransferase [Litorimonas taeanensis]